MGDNVDSSGNGLPVVHVYPSSKLELECPACKFRAIISLKKPLEKRVKATCRKCKKPFWVTPNIRAFYRKVLGLKGKLGRQPIEDSSRRTIVESRIIDLSAKGMGIGVTKNDMEHYMFSIGETLFVAFDLPGNNGEKTIRVSGQLKNIETADDAGEVKLGLEFQNMDHHTENEIRFCLWN